MNMDQVSFELILSNIKVENDFDEPPKLATIPCKLCSRTFIKHSGLNSHYKAHARKSRKRKREEASVVVVPVPAPRPRVDQQHRCQICDQVLSSKQSLDRHIQSHRNGTLGITGWNPKTGSKGPSFPCHQCGKICWRKKHLASHIRTQHPAYQRYTGQDTTCLDCGKVCWNKQSLSRHSRTEHPLLIQARIPQSIDAELPLNKIRGQRKRGKEMRTRYICLFCGRKCPSSSHLRDHMAVHTKEKPYQCPICKDSFSKKSNLDTHYRNHSEKDFKCTRCELHFVTNLALNAHAQSEHATAQEPVAKEVIVVPAETNSKTPLISNKSKVPVCSYCGKQFSCRSHLEEHMVSHTKEKLKIHSCTVCESVFPTSERLEQHTKTHETTICSHCNKQCVTNAKLMSHMTSHTSESIFQCPTCKTVVESKESLARHMKYHTSIGHHKCQECQLSFLFRIQLNQHRLKKHPILGIPESDSEPSESNEDKRIKGQRPKPINPIEFGSVNPSRVSLPRLQLRESKSEVPNEHACQHCGKVFGRIYDVARHEKIHTRKIKLWKCKYCDKQFNRSNYLKNHLRSHKEQSTKCDQRVSFSQIDKHRKGHDDVNINNNNEIPRRKAKNPADLKCKICGKHMSSARSLQMHYKRHDGDTAFKCEIDGCSKSYVDPYLLKRHQRGFHADAAAASPTEKKRLESTPKDVVVSRSGNIERRGRGGRRHVEKFPCEQCDKAYIIKSQLLRHQRLHQAAPTEDRRDQRRPNGVAPSVVIKYACEICNVLFSSTDQLRKHKETHENKPGPAYQYQCMVCVTRFRTHGELIAHQRIHIRRVEVPVATPFSCPICNKGFGTRSKLKAHNRCVHSTKAYKCETCGKTLKNATTLYRHRLSHGPKQFKCSVCSQNFSRKDNLLEHILRCHSTSKNYECLLCDKRFYALGQLSDHRRQVHENRNRTSC